MPRPARVAAALPLGPHEAVVEADGHLRRTVSLLSSLGRFEEEIALLASGPTTTLDASGGTAADGAFAVQAPAGAFPDGATRAPSPSSG